MLTKEQKDYVDSKYPKTRLIADPGSGKTFTLVHKIKTMGYSVAALTFTVRMAAELETKIKKIEYAGTISSFFYNYIKKNYSLCGYSIPPIVLSSLREKGFDTEIKLKWNTKEKAPKVIKKLILGEELSYKESTYFNIYLKTLLSRGWVTYSMIYYFMNELLDKHYDKLTLPQKCIIDEFQDTSAEGRIILEKFKFDELHVIGDPGQSLYEWRGADPYQLAKMSEYKEYRLTKTFRNPSDVCELANKILSKHTPPVKEPNMHSDISGDIMKIDKDSMIDILKKISTIGITTFLLVAYNKTVDYYDSLLASKDIPHNTIGGVHDYKDIAFVIAMVLLGNKSYLIKYHKAIPQEIIEELFKAKDKIKTGIEVLARTKRETDRLTTLFKVYELWYGDKYDKIEEFIESYNPIIKDGMVNIMTIHQSKGLEADFVFVNIEKVNNSNGGIRSKYVAVTRTKKKLFLIEEQKR